MNINKKTISKVAIVIFLIACVVSIYIMKNNIGLIEGLNFGPGQYYYTDIPNWQKYFATEHFHNGISMFIFIALFFIWGYIMYKLWIFLDKKIE